MPYTLITVTYGGEVHHSRGYETLLMCQEARSVALTGMTLAEAAEAKRRADERAAAFQAAQARALAEWTEITWPPRLPTASEVLLLKAGHLAWSSTDGAEHQHHESDGWIWRYCARRFKLGADGLVHAEPERRGGMGPQIFPSVVSAPPRGQIKHAVCVLEMPDAPSEPVAA